MKYTLWSRGRLLGELALDFVRCIPGMRVGFLYPSPLGEQLLPLAGEAAAATIAFGLSARGCANVDELRRTTAYADYRAAADATEASQLELRDADGAVIATHHIAVCDYGYLDELDDELADDDDTPDQLWDPDSVDLLDDHNWPDAGGWPDDRPWSRYQVQVELIDESSVP